MIFPTLQNLFNTVNVNCFPMRAHDVKITPFWSPKPLIDWGTLLTVKYGGRVESPGIIATPPVWRWKFPEHNLFEVLWIKLLSEICAFTIRFCNQGAATLHMSVHTNASLCGFPPFTYPFLLSFFTDWAYALRMMGWLFPIHCWLLAQRGLAGRWCPRALRTASELLQNSSFWNRWPVNDARTFVIPRFAL